MNTFKTAFCDKEQYFFIKIVYLGIRHDTRCDKYCKQSDTNGETVGELGPYLSSFSKCHFSLKCWEFMKCTPTFKLKYKSKLSNLLKLRITLTLPVI